MISGDVQIADLDGEHWANLLGLAAAPSVRREPTLIIFVAGKQVVRALRTGGGAVPGGFAWQGPETPLEPLRRAHGAKRLIIIDVEQNGLAALFRDCESLLAPEQDLAAQVLNVLRGLRVRLGDGVWVDPPLLARYPIPTFDVVQRSFDRIFPDGRTWVLYVMDDEKGTIHSSLILKKVAGDVTLVTGHAAIAAEASIGRGWRREYKQVLTAVRDLIAPVHAGLFIDVAAARRVIHGPGGTLIRELALRKAVLDPAPPLLLGLLGGSAALAAVELASGVLGRFFSRKGSS